jgi:glycosyltransferase involved in cell wall biosynthesis
MRRPNVVRNVPVPLQLRDRYKDRAILRDKFSLDAASTVFIYQGLLSEVRAISRFLTVFSRARDDRHIVFLGYGPLETKVHEYAEKHSTIHFLPAVSPDEVLNYTIGADVGVCGMGGGSLSYRYSLPNKFFEYLQAGIPVLVGDRPEQEAIVDQLQCGWSVANGEEELEVQVNSIDRAEVASKTAGAIQAQESFSWDQEASVMLAEYARIMQRTS